MPFLCMNCFAQILLDSSCAAFCVGPKIGSPFCTNASTIPLESGASGPTTVKQFFDFANSARPSMSSAEISRLFFVPPLPGAKNTLSTCFDCDNFQPNACSRPPEPTTKTLTNESKLVFSYIFEVLGCT